MGFLIVRRLHLDGHDAPIPAPGDPADPGDHGGRGQGRRSAAACGHAATRRSATPRVGLVGPVGCAAAGNPPWAGKAMRGGAGGTGGAGAGGGCHGSERCGVGRRGGWLWWVLETAYA